MSGQPVRADLMGVIVPTRGRWPQRWYIHRLHQCSGSANGDATMTDHDHHDEHAHDPAHDVDNWRLHGVRVVHGNELDVNTPQTPGMNRAAAITRARAGAEKLWAGTVVIHPKAKTGAHHHGPVESVIYIVSGRARMRWGEQLEFTAEAGPGDFIYVPPYVPHQEINANDNEPLSCVLVRSGQDPVVVNLDIPMVEKPEEVRWVDNIHADPDAAKP